MERVHLTEKRQAQVTFPGNLLALCYSGSVQFQVIHVVLDPGLTGIGADLSAPFGLESVEQGVSKRIRVRGTLSVVDIPLCSHWTALVGGRPFWGGIGNGLLVTSTLYLLWPQGCPD